MKIIFIVVAVLGIMACLLAITGTINHQPIQKHTPISENYEKPLSQSPQHLEPKKPILYDDDGDGWVVVPNLDLKIKCLNLQKRIYEDC